LTVLLLLCCSGDPCSVVDCNAPGVLDRIQQAELNVSSIPSMMLVGSNGVLRFQNIIISEIAAVDQYVYSPWQASGAQHLQHVPYSVFFLHCYKVTSGGCSGLVVANVGKKVIWCPCTPGTA
jgi:hypothetical protein